MPIDMSPDDFEQLVADALDLIPDELARHMDNVAVVVADWATPREQSGHRGTLLGLYQGVALTRRGPFSYRGVMPDRITIFRGPHLRLASTEDQLRRRVARTVIHEIGHHFGIDDTRLRQLGW